MTQQATMPCSDEATKGRNVFLALRRSVVPAIRRFPTGFPPFDAALGGGFAVGALHEFLAHHVGAAAWILAFQAAKSAAERRPYVFYFDRDGDLYPPALAAMGWDLGRLILIRPRRTIDPLWGFEQVLRCPAVAAAILPVHGIDATVSRRLQLAAEAGGTLGFLINRSEPGALFAATRLLVEPIEDRHEGARRDGRRSLPAEAGAFLSVPPCLSVKITFLKLRHRLSPPPFVLEVPIDARAVPASAGPADADRAAGAGVRVG